MSVGVSMSVCGVCVGVSVGVCGCECMSVGECVSVRVGVCV